MSDAISRRVNYWFRAISATALILVISAVVSVIRHSIQEARWARCHSNLAQIGLALQNYEDVYGSLPPAYLTNRAGTPLLSWRVLILPYLERDDLYGRIRLDEPWNSPHNISLAPLMPDIYRCPADRNAGVGETSYVAVTGPETLWPGATSTRILALRNSSETILLVEGANSRISWMEPRDLPSSAANRIARDPSSGIVCRHPCRSGIESLNGVHSGYTAKALGYRLCSANCLFADGHVFALSEDTSPETIRRLLMFDKGVSSYPPASGTDLQVTPRRPGLHR